MCPDFFAMYLPVLNRDRLRIPIGFVEHFNGFMPEKAILRDSIGRVWQVEVGQIGKNMYFLNGWQQFLMEKSVEEGDFLVFRYAGNSIFEFKLLGRTECEKKDTEEVDMDIYKKGFCEKENDVEEAVEEEEEEEEGEKEEDEAEEEEVKDDEEEEEKSQQKSPSMETAVLKNKYSTRGHPTIKRKNYYEAEEEEVEDDEEEEEKSQPKSPNMEAAVLKHKYSTRGDPKIKRKNYCGYKQSAVERTRAVYEESARTKSEYRKAFSTQAMVDRALSIERNFESKNPFFIANLRLRKNKLFVPPDILQDFKIVLPPMVSLRNRHGRSWPGKVVVWKDGRTMIGGWKDFCKSNHLDENDICICEFVLENGHHGDLIVVHIHRHNPEWMS